MVIKVLHTSYSAIFDVEARNISFFEYQHIDIIFDTPFEVTLLSFYYTVVWASALDLFRFPDVDFRYLIYKFGR